MPPGMWELGAELGAGQRVPRGLSSPHPTVWLGQTVKAEGVNNFLALLVCRENKP